MAVGLIFFAFKKMNVVVLKSLFFSHQNGEAEAAADENDTELKVRSARPKF